MLLYRVKILKTRKFLNHFSGNVSIFCWTMNSSKNQYSSALETNINCSWLNIRNVTFSKCSGQLIVWLEDIKKLRLYWSRMNKNSIWLIEISHEIPDDSHVIKWDDLNISFPPCAKGKTHMLRKMRPENNFHFVRKYIDN